VVGSGTQVRLAGPKNLSGDRRSVRQLQVASWEAAQFFSRSRGPGPEGALGRRWGCCMDGGRRGPMSRAGLYSMGNSWRRVRPSPPPHRPMDGNRCSLSKAAKEKIGAEGEEEKEDCREDNFGPEEGASGEADSDKECEEEESCYGQEEGKEDTRMEEEKTTVKRDLLISSDEERDAEEKKRKTDGLA
jgi:hypothetical protein